MSSIITATAVNGGLPTEAGYTHGFEMLTGAAIAAAIAAMLVPSGARTLSRDTLRGAMPHAELGLVAAGTLFGDEPE
jgi:hypothetical protein